MLTGTYLIVIKVNEDRKIEVGSLGEIEFRNGYYIYTGSAMNGIIQRLKRHFSRNKKIWWHIDYLTAVEKPEYAMAIQNLKIECNIARNLSKILQQIKGFGSSDCECSSHLFYSSEDPEKHILEVLNKNFNLDSERLIYYTEKGLFKE